MNLVDISVAISILVMMFSLGMGIYGLHLQRTNLKLQQKEVREQNKDIIELLQEISKAVSADSSESSD